MQTAKKPQSCSSSDQNIIPCAGLIMVPKMNQPALISVALHLIFRLFAVYYFEFPSNYTDRTLQLEINK